MPELPRKSGPSRCPERAAFCAPTRMPFGACGRLSLGCGQSEYERAAVVLFAFGADGAAVGAHDVLGDGEAEAGSSGFAGSGFVHAIEALEQARQVLRRNAAAEVADIEFDSPLGGTSAEFDACTGASVLHRVIDQVRKNLVNSLSVGQNQRQGVGLTAPVMGVENLEIYPL